MILIDKKYKAPDIGDIKTKKRFAFFPKKIKGKIVFLEKYETVYAYLECQYSTLSLKSWVKISDVIIDR